jgi:hypothetical protein
MIRRLEISTEFADLLIAKASAALSVIGILILGFSPTASVMIIGMCLFTKFAQLVPSPNYYFVLTRLAQGWLFSQQGGAMTTLLSYFSPRVSKKIKLLPYTL